MSSLGHSGTAAGGELEEKNDFTKETDETLANVTTLLSSNSLPEALAALAALEKKCRTGNDNKSLARVCTAAVQACKDDSAALLQTLHTYATRRSQKMAAIRALVETALPWCVQEPYTPVPTASKEEQTARDALVTALRDITDGKLFLERERAQLTRAYATIKVCMD